MIVALSFLKRAWPYLVGAVLILAVVLGSLYGAYAHGVTTEGDRLKAKHAMDLYKREQIAAIALQKQADESKASLDAANAIARANLTAQAATQATFTTLMDDVHTYANTNATVHPCGLDADGLRLWADANRGTRTQPAAAGSP